MSDRETKQDGFHLGFKRVTLENALVTDPVVTMMATRIKSTGEFRAQEPGDWIPLIMSVGLRARVHNEVRRMFVFAQGAMCYVHWYYPALTLGIDDMLRIADFAVVQACKQRSIRKKTFEKRIDALCALNAIATADEPIWDTIRNARNRATHPSAQNVYGFAQAYDMVKFIAGAIDRIDWYDPSHRPATHADRAFVERVYFETQRALIEQLFGWCGDETERGKFAEFYDVENTRIVAIGDEDVGWFTLQRFPSHHHLQSIFLMERWQDRGIGGTIISDLVADAVDADLPIRLSTAKINRAQGLYRRLGFLRLREDKYKAYFEHDAGRVRAVQIRAVRDVDFDLLYGWFSDPAFVRWWGGVPKTPEEVATKYLGHRDGVSSYIVEHEGVPVGYIQSWKVDADTVGIDVVLEPDHQGNGIGVEAVRLLAQSLRDDGWARVLIDPAAGNVVAVRAFTKAGFEKVADDADGHVLMRFVN
jgi:aminoglycoside 6'-N-acetyltransferase